MDFQTIILKLQKFWGEQKCILTQPYAYVFKGTRS